jgi:hypothetical protein
MLTRLADMNVTIVTGMNVNTCYWHEYYYVLPTSMLTRVTDMNVTAVTVLTWMLLRATDMIVIICYGHKCD